MRRRQINSKTDLLHCSVDLKEFCFSCSFGDVRALHGYENQYLHIFGRGCGLFSNFISEDPRIRVSDISTLVN